VIQRQAYGLCDEGHMASKDEAGSKRFPASNNPYTFYYRAESDI
jgi:hypothetical protein